MFDTAAGLWTVVGLGTLVLVALMALMSAANKPPPPPSEDALIAGAIVHLRQAKNRQARRDALSAYVARLPSPSKKQELRLLAGKLETAHTIRHAYNLKTASGRRRHLEQAIAELRADPVDDDLQATELLLLTAAHEHAEDHGFWAEVMEGLDHGDES